MIQRVHEHIITELQQNTRTDTIFVLTAIILNLLSLGVNSGVAAAAAQAENSQTTFTIVMFTFVALVLVVNVVATIGLIRGKQSRAKLITGLLKMYQDQGVAGYYDASLLSNYNTRYNLFILATVFTGAVALIVPFVLFATL